MIHTVWIKLRSEKYFEFVLEEPCNDCNPCYDCNPCNDCDGETNNVANINFAPINTNQQNWVNVNTEVENEVKVNVSLSKVPFADLNLVV